MSDVVKVALIVGFFGLIGPLVLAWLTDQQRKRDKQHDEERQDALAIKQAARDRLLAAKADQVAVKAEEAAALLKSNTAIVIEQTKATTEKLDVIHGLVNSNMTRALQSEYDAVVRELAMMNEVVALKRSVGGYAEPSDDTLAAIKATEAKIAELSATLIERNRAPAAIDTPRTMQP